MRRGEQEGDKIREGGTEKVKRQSLTLSFLYCWTIVDLFDFSLTSLTSVDLC